jgi:hypothetical protein
MCSLARHITSLLSGIARLECKMVKNANQCVGLLFTGAEFSGKFPSNLCSICWSNHPRAFVGLVGGKMLSKFCIQMFMHFCCKKWRKMVVNRAKWNCFWAGCACTTCHVGLATVPPGAQAGAGPRPPVQGQTPRILYAYGRDTPPTPRPVTRGRGTHARAPPSATGGTPPHVANRLGAHAIAPVGHDAWAKLPCDANGL